MFEMYDVDLVGARLNRAIVQIDGKYQYIMEVRGTKDKGYTALTSNGIFKINQGNVNYVDMRIGMVPLSGTHYWSYRLPVRRWKAGLNYSNYVVQLLGATRWMYVKKQMFEDNIDSIINMLGGIYIPFSEAVALGEGVVSQHFAVKEDFLFYKSKNVASIANKQVVFKNNFKFLRERFLQETKCIPE